MSLRTQYEFLFVGRDEGSFVENYAYDLGEGGEHSGKIFINVEIQNNPAEAEMIGETIFDTVRKAFFADLEKEHYVRFEDALKAVNKALNALKTEKSSQFIGNLHVVVAAIVDNNLFLTQCGDAEAYLVRRRFCSIISDGLSDQQSKDFFTNIATGTLEAGDFVLLSSTRLLRYITKNDLAKIAHVHNLVAALGELKDFLSAEILGRVGFIGVIASAQEAVPFSSKEQGQMAVHLEKEEEYEKQGVKTQKTLKVVMLHVGNFGKKIGGFVADFTKRLTAKKAPAESGKVVRGSNGGMAWTKDKIVVGIIVIVLVLTLGVWWLRAKFEEQDKINHYTAILNEVHDEIGSAETTGQYNKDQAGQMLDDAEKKALDVLNSRFDAAKARELLTSVKDERDKLDAVMHVQPKVVADLSQKRSNVSAVGLLALKSVLYAYEYNALYPILLDKVQSPLTIDDNETIIDATVYNDNNSLLFYSKAGKVIEYKDNRMNFLQAVEGSYHKGFAVQGYNNKFYVLDPVGNQIWRYTRRRDQFDTAQAYNIDGDVKKGVEITIDGNIYVLNSDGSITKFFSGNKQDVVVKKPPLKPLTTPTKIFTQLDMNQLYILEPSTHRVMVLFKDDRTGALTYNSQYVFEDLNDIRDFYVDKDAKKMYLLDQSKVYEFSL